MNNAKKAGPVSDRSQRRGGAKKSDARTANRAHATGRSPTGPASPSQRSVEIQTRHPRLRVPIPAVRKLIAVLDAARERFDGGCPPGELSLVFLTDPALAKIHADFMNDPSATDVITFEGDPAAGLAGEICVSADTAQTYAREHRRDFAAELTLYVVHGWLHLAGYDDLQPAKKRRMRAAEARAMKLLHEANAVPQFRLGRK